MQRALDLSLCIRDFASMKIEKHNKPEVEMLKFTKKKTDDINLNPIYLARSEQEYCLIEPSINSVRVITTKKFNYSKAANYIKINFFNHFLDLFRLQETRAT